MKNKFSLIHYITVFSIIIVIFGFVAIHFKVDDSVVQSIAPLTQTEESFDNITWLYEYFRRPVIVYLIPDELWVEYWQHRFKNIYDEEQLKEFETTVGEFLIQMQDNGSPIGEMYVRWNTCDNHIIDEIINYEGGRYRNKLAGEIMEKFNLVPDTKICEEGK